MSRTIRINVKFHKDDKQQVIDQITKLPAGIKLTNQKEIKTCHRFIFTVTNYRLVTKLFSALRSKVKRKYPFMPVNPKTVKP